MKRQEDKLDDLLKQKLGGLEGETSSSDWSAISERLDKKRKNPGIPFSQSAGKYLSMLVLILIGTGIGYYLHKDNVKVAPSGQNIGSNANSAQTQVPSGQNIGSINETISLQTKVPSGLNIGSTTGNNKSTLPVPSGLNIGSTGGNNKSTLPVPSGLNIGSTTGNNKSTIPVPSGLNIGSTGGNNKSTLPVPSGLNIGSTTGNNKSTIPVPSGLNVGSTTDNNESTLPVPSGLNVGSTTDNNKSTLPVPSGRQFGSNLSVNKNSISKIPTTNTTSLLDSYITTPKTNNPTASANQKDHFALFLSFAPEISNHNLINNPAQTDYTHQDYYNIRANQEKAGTGYAASFGIQYKAWNKLILQAGIGYKTITEKVNYDFKNDKIPVVDSASGKILGYIHLNPYTTSSGRPNISETKYSHTNTYNYITVPFLIGYSQKLSNKFALIAKAGGALMWLNAANGEALKPDDLTLQSISDLHLMRKNNITYYGSLELEYTISKYISLSLGPNFQQMNKSIYIDNAPVSFKPRTTGLIFTTKINLF